MEHQECMEIIKSGIYNELNKEMRMEFDNHITECSECREELLKHEKLFNMINNIKQTKTDEQLLNEARMELRGALRMTNTIPDHNSIAGRFLQSIKNLFSPGVRFAFSGIAILLVGIFAGYLIFHSRGTSEFNQSRTDMNKVSNALLSENNTIISNVQIINKNDQTGEIEFKFDATKPVHIKGNINDQQVQGILLYAMLNEPNPGVRLNTIDAINTDKSNTIDDDIKSAVIKVAETDENPGVRKAAIELLKKFPVDNEIKKALLSVLQHDTNSALRIEAIKILMSVKNNELKYSPQDINILKDKMNRDENNYVRFAAKTVLGRNE